MRLVMGLFVFYYPAWFCTDVTNISDRKMQRFGSRHVAVELQLHGLDTEELQFTSKTFYHTDT